MWGRRLKRRVHSQLLLTLSSCFLSLKRLNFYTVKVNMFCCRYRQVWAELGGYASSNFIYFISLHFSGERERERKWVLELLVTFCKLDRCSWRWHLVWGLLLCLREWHVSIIGLDVFLYLCWFRKWL